MRRGFELLFAPRAFLITLLLLPCFGATAAEQRVGEHLFLVRDKPGTSTHFQMIVGAGCNDEIGGECRGVAHYLEHLMLVGRNPEHKEIALRFFSDGSSNGWTSQRATVYVHSMPTRENGPRADLEKLFEFYAARLKDFAVSDVMPSASAMSYGRSTTGALPPGRLFALHEGSTAYLYPITLPANG